MSISAIWTWGIGAVAVMGTWITLHEKLINSVLKFFDWIAHRKPLQTDAHLADIPKHTIRAAAHPQINALTWAEASFQDKPAMQVVGDFDVTNIWTDGVRLFSARLRYKLKWWRHYREHVTVPLVQSVRSTMSGSYAIPPKASTHVRLGFTFVERDRPPPCVLLADIVFVDQFGNEHWLRRQKFKHHTVMFDS